MSDEFNLDPNQFSDDFEIDKVSGLLIKAIDTTEDILAQLKTHLELGEKSQFRNKTAYLMNRLAELVTLLDADEKELPEEELDKLCDQFEDKLSAPDLETILGMGITQDKKQIEDSSDDDSDNGNKNIFDW